MSTCTVCGGNGIQRVSSQRFRTCLACLGTGKDAPDSEPQAAEDLKVADAVLPRSCLVPGGAG